MLLFIYSFIYLKELRWERLYECKRKCEWARAQLRSALPGSFEEHRAARSLSQMKEKLLQYGKSLGISEAAIEAPLPPEYQRAGTPPFPKWR